MVMAGRRCHVDHGWLPLVLPATARRFRVSDPDYRETLADAGAQFVDESPDVEIASLEELRGDAGFVVVPLATDLPEGASRWERAARRSVGNIALRARATAAVRTLRARGFQARYVTWDLDRTFLAAEGDDIRQQRLRDRVHRYALVIGTRTDASPTLLERAQEASGAAQPKAPLIARVAVSLSAAGVLRVAVGPARRQIESQIEALAQLRAAEPSPAVDELVSWVLAEGQVGIARWSVEELKPGSSAEFPLADRLREDAVEFLVALFRTGAGGPPGPSAADHAEAVAGVRPAQADGLRRIAAEADTALAGVARGFAHGDFWTGNLLERDGSLAGVVDWDSAGPGRLPLLDLMHLQVNAEHRLRPNAWGSAVVEALLPWAAAGGDEISARYLAAIGVELGPTELRALVVAYWLERVAYQVSLYDDIATSELWLESNVDTVLRALEPWRRPSGAIRVVPAQPDAIRGEWARLAEAARNVFATPEWVQTWAAWSGEQTEVHAAYEGDRLAAVLPVTTWQERPFNVLRFAGHGPADRLGPACADDDRGVALAALEELWHTSGAHVFVGEQTGRSEGWSARLGATRVSSTGSPVIHLRGSTWDEFLAARSRNLREQVRRRERKLFKEHDAAFRLATAETIEADFEQLLTLHTAHWGAASTFSRHAAFHRSFLAAASDAGWARLWTLDVDGAAVAAWYGFRYAGVECYYQAGRDPAWEHRSVGFVLLSHTIRAALEDGADEYWFLRGGESYKYRFGDADPGLETWALTRGPVSLAALTGVRAGRRLRGR